MVRLVINTTLIFIYLEYSIYSVADMPQFMLDADRIVGGEAAPSPIPWQVALLSGSFQFCGATILDASTLLCAAHCQPSTSHSIRVGSVSRSSGGQVCLKN